MADTIFAYAYLNVRITPLYRGDRYEDPLAEALEENGLGEITGGGTGQGDNGEISYCGIDLELDADEFERATTLVCKFLANRGAPKGSKLQFEIDGERKEIPFGFLEGLAVYINGTELPDEVYRDCDTNYVYEEIERLLGDRGEIQGHWQGPTETALYLYGYSAEEMKKLIAPLMDEYPLCQKARYDVIA